MPLFIDVTAAEPTGFADPILPSIADENIVAAFRYVERGIMGDPPRSRTALNGKWNLIPTIIRSGNNTVSSAMLTWELTDDQMAASGLTDQSKITAFAQKLVNDVRDSLNARANRLGRVTPLWDVTSVLRTVPRVDVGPGPTPTPPQPPPPREDTPQETSYWPLAGGFVLVGVAAYFLTRK